MLSIFFGHAEDTIWTCKPYAVNMLTICYEYSNAEHVLRTYWAYGINTYTDYMHVSNIRLFWEYAKNMLRICDKHA